jgi:hypothetical protein
MLLQMIRAAWLDPTLYDEVARDGSATARALTVVVLASLAGAIGSALSGFRSPLHVSATTTSFLVETASTLLGWAAIALSIYIVGRVLFGGKATFGRVLRTTAFANAPLVLGALVFLPVVGLLVAVVSIVWAIVALVASVRCAFGFGTGKALLLGACSVVVLLVPALLLARIALAFGLFA